MRSIAHCCLHGDWLSLSGLCTSYLMGSVHKVDTSSTCYRKYPALPTTFNDYPCSELDVIIVRKEGTANSHRDFHVRRPVVLHALQWLVTNKYMYYHSVHITLTPRQCCQKMDIQVAYTWLHWWRHSIPLLQIKMKSLMTFSYNSRKQHKILCNTNSLRLAPRYLAAP